MGRRVSATTLVAGRTPVAVSTPTYEPKPTASWFALAPQPDGWWRACGPESTWLTVEILAWLQRADRPFAERFVWPHLAVTNRDRRTGLPFYGYFADLERLFDAIPGLSAASIDVAFIDLAGFGVFNNEFGMERGDDLRMFARALAWNPRVDGDPGWRGRVHRSEPPQLARACRSGWRHFVSRGRRSSPTRTAPEACRRHAFLTTTTTGAQIIEARNDLGEANRAAQSDHESVVGPLGIQFDLGQVDPNLVDIT